jgi:hypothetical protein
MDLPEDVLALIREYSKPCTDPQWKQKHWFTLSVFQNDLRFTISKIILYRPRTYSNYVKSGLLTETLYKNVESKKYNHLEIKK